VALERTNVDGVLPREAVYAGGLRHWAHQLDREAPKPQGVRFVLHGW